MNVFTYVETYCILLSIPIIYILYTSSIIRKEFTKREKDREYCQSDIMEGETLRNYANTSEYKSLNKSIYIACGLFFGILCICMLLIVCYGTPVGMNITSIEAFIIVSILLILSFFLFIPVSDDTKEYNTTLIKLKNNIIPRLIKVGSFENFPEAFKTPFIERWLSLQPTNTLLTTRETISAIDKEFLKSPENIVNFLRPSKNYFVEDKEVVLKNDTEYLYNKLRANTSVTLPLLSKYTDFIKYNDTVAWIILIFLYYNIFHIYSNKVYLFTEITIGLTIILLLFMLIYYITIVKDEL